MNRGQENSKFIEESMDSGFKKEIEKEAYQEERERSEKTREGFKFLIDGLGRGLRVRKIELDGLQDRPELKRKLVDCVLNRDHFIISLTNGRVMEFKSGLDLGNLGDYEGPPSNFLRIYSTEQFNTINELLDEREEIEAEWKVTSQLDNGSWSSPECKKYSEKVKNLNERIRHFWEKEKIETIRGEKEYKKWGQLSKFVKEFLSKNTAETFFGETVSGRRIEVDDQKARIDYGTGGSRDFLGRSLGVDPLYDTPEEMKVKAERNGLETSILFLEMVGKPKEVEKIQGSTRYRDHEDTGLQVWSRK